MIQCYTGLGDIRGDAQMLNFHVSNRGGHFVIITMAQARGGGGGGGGGTFGISGWGCAAETLEPLTYTRASSVEFCYPIVE